MTEHKELFDRKHIDEAVGRSLRLVAPVQPVSSQQVARLQSSLESARVANPHEVKDFAIYSELERRRLTVELGVVGVHARLHEAAGTYSRLMSDVGIVALHGRHEWAIDH